MAKKKIETEEPEAAEPKVHNVSVEMTEEQKEEFIQWKLDQEKKAAVAAEPVEPESVYRLNLIYRHNINGVSYGPGPATIPGKLLGLLQHQENVQRGQEISLNVSTKRMYEVFMDGASAPVKVK